MQGFFCWVGLSSTARSLRSPSCFTNASDWVRVRDRGIVEAPVDGKHRDLSSLELEGRSVPPTEQSDCRKPDPELAALQQK